MDDDKLKVSFEQFKPSHLKYENETLEFSFFHDNQPFNRSPYYAKMDIVPFPSTDIYFYHNFFPPHFIPQKYHLYHGTSTDALDRILESGSLRTAADLHRSGELVSGEMKQLLDTQGDSISGPKYLHPEMFRRLGIELSENDMRILGHAYAIFFGSFQMAQGYTPKDPQKKALLVLNTNALEDRGYSLVDCKGEGIKCERSISLDFGFQGLLVPDTMVEAYKARIDGKYFTSVFPISNLDKS